MQRASITLVLTAWAAAHSLSGAELFGRLQLADAGPFTTPVQNLGMALQSVDRSTVIRAQVDQAGRFIFQDLAAGRYAFDLSFPGRFVSVVLGGKPIVLPEFKLSNEDRGPLEIVVSMKTSNLSVDVRGLPSQGGQVVAILSPSDSSLTLRYSCYLNNVPGQQTEFRFVPPGTYRLFIVDEIFKSDVSAYAPRFPSFLKEQSLPFVIAGDSGAKATATYIDARALKEAIRLAGPLHP